MTFFDLSYFSHTLPDVLYPVTKPSSCLPRRAVGAKRLADLSHNEGFTARSRRTSTMVVGGCYSGLSGHKSKKVTSSERSASRNLLDDTALRARSRRTSAMLPGRCYSELSDHKLQSKLKSHRLRPKRLFRGREQHARATPSAAKATPEEVPGFATSMFAPHLSPPGP